MKRILLTILFLAPTLVGATSLKVESFNLRYDNPDDGINAWPERRAMVVTHIQSVQPEILALQEVLAHQLDWLSGQLMAYHCLGAGRDDGKRQGEFVPVCYRKDKLELLDSGHFWLSDTPSQAGSIGWGAELPRVTTWLKLKHKVTDKPFLIFNTHFSHVSTEARNKSAELLLKQVQTTASHLPVIISGDFNARPSGHSYQYLTQNLMFPLQDTANGFSSDPTYNGFGKANPPMRLDYIFTSKDISSLDFKIYKIEVEGIYISDHYPIVANIILP